MPLNAVMAYVRDTLDGLQLPGNTGNLTAYINPPDPDDNQDGTPRAFVWATAGDEKRRALPRNAPATATTPAIPGGWKDMNHTLEIYLVYFQADEEPDQDSAFPGFIDAVMNALRTNYPDPVFLTDPLTGSQSQLVDLGERMTWRMEAIHSLASQRWQRLDSLLTCEVLEEIQA